MLRFLNKYIVILVDLRKTNLRWADGANVKREVDLQMITLLGPKTEAELAPPSKKKAQLIKTNPLENKSNPIKEENGEIDQNDVRKILRSENHSTIFFHNFYSF